MRFREGSRGENPPLGIRRGNSRTWNRGGELSCPLGRCVFPRLCVFWCRYLTLGLTVKRGPNKLQCFERGDENAEGPWSVWGAATSPSAGNEKTPREAGEPCSGHRGIWNRVLCLPPDTLVTKFYDPASKYFSNSALPQTPNSWFSWFSRVTMLIPTRFPLRWLLFSAD